MVLTRYKTASERLSRRLTVASVADLHDGKFSAVLDLLSEAKPDIVLVHGDTTTSFAAALAAFYAK